MIKYVCSSDKNNIHFLILSHLSYLVNCKEMFQC